MTRPLGSHSERHDLKAYREGRAYRPSCVGGYTGQRPTSPFNVAEYGQFCTAGNTGAEYTEKVACEYIPRLCAALNECAPKAVIFHGKGAFRAYGVGKAFGLDHTVKPEITHGLEIYEDRRIVVCGNFSRGSTFTNAEKGYVTEKLRGWLG